MTPDLVGHRSVGEAFLERAAAHPERTAVTLVHGGAITPDESITFGELANRAELRAAHLAARLAPGERVVIALPTCGEFAELYLACLLAGLVAVPVPAPGMAANAVDRIAGIVRDCDPRLAVTADVDAGTLTAGLREAGLADTPVETVGELGRADTSGLGGFTPGPDTLAVLQYSSGSTGRPKGAALAHRNILADVQDIAQVTGLGADDVFGTWLPLYHDMGLFGLLTGALLFGAPIVLMRPTAFVRRPVDWFRMMTRHGVTITAAPNFAFDLCQRLIDDSLLDGVDLSRLRVAYNGSEPIHAPTVAAFTQRFARVGVRPETVSPAYGMAEATVFVSAYPVGTAATLLAADLDQLEDAEHARLVAAPADAPDVRVKKIVGVGRMGMTEARIVDPKTCEVLPARTIGEVWLRGPSIGSGYWNQTEATAHSFGARLATGDEGWFRTGDLGAFLDGELFITGRLKEMMIIRGRNLFPQDLEYEARAAHHALTGFVGAAFGVATPEEQVVLIHEVDPKLPSGELPMVADTVSRRLTLTFGVPIRNIMLVRRGTVRRTTSGKIERAAMRERFLTGQVPALHTELASDVRRVQQGGAG